MSWTIPFLQLRIDVFLVPLLSHPDSDDKNDHKVVNHFIDYSESLTYSADGAKLREVTAKLLALFGGFKGELVNSLTN
jgi:hypothetical protein